MGKKTRTSKKSAETPDDRDDKDDTLVQYHLNLPRFLKEKWMDNLPTGFSNLADFIRKIVTEYYEGRLVSVDHESGIKGDDLEDLKKFLEKIKNNILEEVRSLQLLIKSNQAVDQGRRERNAEKLKAISIKQLKDLWLKDPDIIECKTIEELAAHIKPEWDHLRNYSYTVVDLLEKERYFTLRRGNKIEWREDLL